MTMQPSNDTEQNTFLSANLPVSDPTTTPSPEGAATQRYRFGFVLTTAAGNMTRYINLRKYADRDAEVECVWAPVSHYLNPDPYRKLPGPLRSRLIVMRQAQPVMSQLSRMDAVMFHAFEPSIQAALRSHWHRRPLLAWSADNPPVVDPANYPSYQGDHSRSPRRQRLRLMLDHWLLSRFALFFPFSQWAGDTIVQGCGIAAERVHPINVGLDLELWPLVPPKDATDCRPQILFVGANFVRKGGDLLLDIYRQRFASKADLHLVTTEPPAELPDGVFVHSDMKPNDPRLRQLYAESDVFVMPTRADMSPWVVLEAMATGLPVVSSRLGGIPDMVKNGESGFLLEPGETNALADALDTLLSDPARRRAMGATGRSIIEKHFSAEVCVPRILGEMKRAVNASPVSRIRR